MPSIFGYEFNMQTLTRNALVPCSSSCARNAGRLNLATQALGSGFNFLPGANIPAKFSQMLISGFTVIRHGPHVHERILHILQLLIAATEMGLDITLLYQDEKCLELSSNLCKTACLISLLYMGVLTTNQVVSEISKESHATQTQTEQTVNESEDDSIQVSIEETANGNNDTAVNNV